jgi:hypothetical protein
VRFTEIFSVLVSSMCGTLPQSAEVGPWPQPAGLGALTSGPVGTIPVPRCSASRTTAAGMPLGNVTRLRCGGCQACALYARNERWCGQLVLAFLGLHELCGKAVRITCVRGGHF